MSPQVVPEEDYESLVTALDDLATASNALTDAMQRASDATLSLTRAAYQAGGSEAMSDFGSILDRRRILSWVASMLSSGGMRALLIRPTSAFDSSLADDMRTRLEPGASFVSGRHGQGS